MKSLAIMQPYFLPYIGYFQLIEAVDKFIIYDDVNFINKGWINRNNILVDCQQFKFTIPILGLSQNKHINQLEINKDLIWIKKIKKTVEYAYKKAPYFDVGFNLFLEIMDFEGEKFNYFVLNSIEKISNYLEISTVLVSSSTIYKNNHLSGQDRIIDICKKENAEIYINSIGGKAIYNKELFDKENINLKFLKSNHVNYKQFNCNFIPSLSILDVIMFNDLKTIKNYLSNYEFI
jgi:hypothetical protein